MNKANLPQLPPEATGVTQFPLTATTEAAPGEGTFPARQGGIVDMSAAVPLPENSAAGILAASMPLLNPGPFDPEKHEHQEPPGAGDGYWLKETMRVVGHSIAKGELLNGAEAGKLLGVTRQRVRELALQGIVRREIIGRYSFYPRVDLEAWAKQRDAGNRPTGRGHKGLPVFKAA